MDKRGKNRDNSSITVGWLFADLLLALAMIFLIANTINSAPKVVAKVKPTPTITPTPTPTPIPRLETHYKRIIIQIDANGLLQGDENAVNQAKQEIRSQQVLQRHNVGLVIVYGGAPTVNDITSAKAIASKMYDIMRSLGKEHFAFSKASYYDPVYDLGTDTNEITIDIFLFVE